MLDRRSPKKIGLFCLCLLLGLSVGAGAEQNQLAILTFRPVSMEAMGYNGEILYALISALERDGRIELMPRREMEERLFQAGMVQGDTPEMALAAGNVLGIKFVLFGRVDKKGNRILAQAYLLDVGGQKTIRSWNENFSGREDILARVPGFAEELVEGIQQGGGAPAAVDVAPVPAVSIENLRARNEGKKVVVTWKFDPQQPIVGFHVYRGDAPEGPFQFLGKTDRNIYQDDRIKMGSAYYYRIGILTAGGQEVKHGELLPVKNAGEKVPHPPLVLGGQAYIRRAEIRFVPSLVNEQEHFKITAYKIYRKNENATEWRLLATVAAKSKSPAGLGFSYEDRADLSDGQTLHYGVASVDRKGKESPLSDPIILTTLDRPVLSLARDRLLRRVDLAWQPLENIEGYYVYRRTVKAPWQRVDKVRGATKGEFVDDKDLEDGLSYEYHVTGYDKYGETGPSNLVAARTKDLPGPPADLLPQSEMVKSVHLTWTPLKDPDVGGYTVYRGESRDAMKAIARVKGVDAHQHLDKGTVYAPLADGAYYYYTVASFNRYGAEGRPGPTEIARTKPRPSSPHGMVLSAGADHILVQWERNPETDIKSYILYRRRNSGTYYRIAQLEAATLRYEDSEIRPDATYGYRLIAEDRDGLKSDAVDSDEITSPLIPSE